MGETLSNFMTQRVRNRRRAQFSLGVLDVPHAQVHPPVEREVYIDLPTKDASPGKAGLMKKTILWMRDDAAQWKNLTLTRSGALESMPDSSHAVPHQKYVRVVTRRRHVAP